MLGVNGFCWQKCGDFRLLQLYFYKYFIHGFIVCVLSYMFLPGYVGGLRKGFSDLSEAKSKCQQGNFNIYHNFI